MRCLFCNSENNQPASFPRPTQFNQKIFKYRQCNDCGLVFVDSVPDGSDYSKMYANSYHEQFYFKQSPDYTNWLELFGKYSQDKSMLDYGCGDGGFLRFFQQKGYSCTGVEYDPQLVERLRKENPGIEFFTVEEFWALPELRTFNAIFMGDVLEHLSTPASFLEKLNHKLKPGGLIAAQGPLENNPNLALRVRKLISGLKTRVKKNSIASHVPYHIFFSDAKNQKAVFEQSGLTTRYYKVFEISWPFPEKFRSSPGQAFQFLAAKTSIILSKALPGYKGNRFLYVGEKN